MRYQINKSNYHTFDIFEVNKLKGRSYFIPYPDKTAADAVAPKEKRYQSPKVICLNGDWDFKFFPIPKELPDVLDTEKTSFDTLDVPSCWQFRGYDRPFYVNIRYQFPYNPPVIPTTEKAGKVFSWTGCDQGISYRKKDPGEEYNFVGVYRKAITCEDPTKKHIISFMGVASCMDLYLNGEFVGYSEGSHNTAEFDLTGKLVQGENEILVVVHRWCNGTYLESQDMFRNNGIFRDVLLRVSDPEDPWDLAIKTEKTGETYKLTVEVETFEDTEVKVTLKGQGIEETAKAESQDKKVKLVFENLKVTEWNAEAPVLYNLYVETPTSCTKEKIGFRTVTIEEDVFLVNGKKIKFKGVNHHDTSAVNGYCMTPDEIEKDIDVCKEFNIDTIRTSHYPPDPLLLELADEKGIYIVDENDLETHGTFAHLIPPTYNAITHDPKWEAHYVDRISRLYQRDKNHPSIVMWSLGNEAGGYYCTDAEYRYLKAHSDIPVHYENCIHSKREAYDVGSEMYPTVKMVHEVGEKKRKQKRLNNRPYFLCEYAHAMGVGPGNTEAYWKEIYNYDSLMGGCVWEMVDHAVLHEDGNYTYGGDHGEWEHDKNFCVDGMFYPDRRPSTGAWIMKFIYRPIRVTHIGGNQFEIFNTTAFSEGSNYKLTFRWNDGSITELIPEVSPLTRKEMTVNRGEFVDENLSCIVTCTDLRTGKEVSEEQITITEKVAAVPADEKKALPANFSVKDGKVELTLADGKVLTSAPEYTLLYRARTDNDTNPLYQDTMAPFADQKEEFVSSREVENGIEVVTRVTNKKARFLVTDTYEGTEDGILVTSTLQKIRGGGIIPRFGKSFRLDESFDDVTYTGRVGESYNDMKDQFVIGTVSCKVTDMTEPNIRPQESGNRCDCTTAALTDGKETVTFDAVEKSFELGIKPYTDRELYGMKHLNEEKRSGTYVTIQAFQQGIGTGACGPAIAPEFQYSSKKDYTLKFLIRTR